VNVAVLAALVFVAVAALVVPRRRHGSEQPGPVDPRREGRSTRERTSHRASRDRNQGANLLNSTELS
jgi:hypothetical protein